MADPQSREGPTFPDVSDVYEGMDFFLTADETWSDLHAYTPGHYVYLSGATPNWAPFGGATKYPPGTPT